ncbi:MAG: fibronectin type III domain-containing protein [Chloroflexota bacterium]|nr:fibronectin type III domain-containing protein [Chloroflexota bacterium]
MSGSQRSVARRCLIMSTAALLLVTMLVAVPTFMHGSAAPIPFGSPAFAAQWNSIEPKVPNFWGPAYQNIFPEPYQEATGGKRFIQYFDKARMEQTTANGPVTNGLLTVELMSGQRQFGDNTFVAYPPSTLPIVGDPTNVFPTYASLAASALPPKVNQITAPNGNVYGADGTLTLNSQLAASPGAAFGSYQADPGNRFAHNIPLAFWTYLTALPTPWQTAMGFPLTEAFWSQVTLNATPTWVLMQPFERRVLSYTPTNPTGFQVEMGNIGQHYYQWRYMTNPGGLAGPATATPIATLIPTTFSTPDPCATPTPLPTSTGTPTTATATPTATPVVCTTPTSTGSVQGVEILNFRQAGLTDTSFSFTFNTNLAATSYIRYGTSSGSYSNAQDIATAATRSHSATISGLTPGTYYYFVIRVSSSVDSINRSEDYFLTTGDSSTPTQTDTPVPPTNTPLPGVPPTVAATATGPIPTRVSCLPGVICTGPVATQIAATYYANQTATASALAKPKP